MSAARRTLHATVPGLKAGYEQRDFPVEERNDRLCLVGSRDGRDGSVTIHQDVNLYVSLLAKTQSLGHTISEDRKGWVQVTRGSIMINEQPATAGDGVAIDGPLTLSIIAEDDAEFLLFDMGDSTA